MPDIHKQTPMQMAENLRREHETRAVYKASVEAYAAIKKSDISACLFWNEVLKILNTGIETQIH